MYISICIWLEEPVYQHYEEHRPDYDTQSTL